MRQSIKHELWVIDDEEKKDDEDDEDDVFRRVKYNLVVAVQVMFDNPHAQAGQLIAKKICFASRIGSKYDLSMI